MKWMKLAALTLVCVLGLALVACGDDDDAGDNGDGVTETPAATNEPTEAPTDQPTEVPTEAPTDAPTEEPTGQATDGAEDEFQVETQDFAFVPASFTVPAGTELKFEVTNTGGAPHTMTIYRDNSYSDPVEGGDTGTINGGEDGSVDVTFADAGTYFFRCDIHPALMQGTITAE